MCDAQKGELFDARIERLRKMKSNKQKNSIDLWMKQNWHI